MTTTLLCLGFAGAGASFFHPWKQAAPAGVDVYAPQLPGREWRIDEDPPMDIDDAVESIWDDVLNTTAGRRVALLGQCFGAVVAYELALRLAVTGVELVHFFASGAASPLTARERWATGLDDEHLISRVREDAGYVHEALDIPELRDLIMPALRADMEGHESYVPQPTRHLAIPITATRGRDDKVVGEAAARNWAQVTTAGFDYVEFEGGHMYLLDHTQALMRLIANSCSREV